MDELSAKTWRQYAKACSAASAQSHALSDDLGAIDYDVEPAIMQAAGPRGPFVADVLEFAKRAAARLQRDHVLFREHHARGAFDRIDMVYR